MGRRTVGRSCSWNNRKMRSRSAEWRRSYRSTKSTKDRRTTLSLAFFFLRGSWMPRRFIRFRQESSKNNIIQEEDKLS
ncbi:hypothetical protein ACROYT_G013444 [Oculina patagonica]